MDFVTFEQWCAWRLASAIEQGLELEIRCDTCNGTGEAYCRNCDQPHDCHCCEGRGELCTDPATIKTEDSIKVFNVEDYFSDMIKTFNQLAYSQNKPLIDVVGPFIVYYRKAFEKWGR